jgi:ERCC4-type nuclease
MLVTVDTREPEPHPWEQYLPDGWRFERGTLETGDLALAALPDGAVVERKTPGDMVSCIGKERTRFERELKRGRYCGRMIVVVEGSLVDVVMAGQKMHHNAIIGTIAAWTLRRLSRTGGSSRKDRHQGRWLAMRLQIRLHAAQRIG